MSEAQWDPAAVIARASELIQGSNYEKVAEARADVDAVIGEWVRVALALEEGSTARARAAARVAEAWGRYAQLEMGLRQFKQATKVFESAVGCAVTRDATALWLQYAAFCVDRKKLSNARKVFARAVHAVPEAEREQVWTRFLAFVREHIDPKVTLEALQAQMQATALPTTPSVRSSPTNSVATPSTALAMAETASAATSADASTTALAASTTDADADAVLTAEPMPSPPSGDAEDAAKAPDEAVDSAACMEDGSRTDSTDAAANTSASAVDLPAEGTQAPTPTPDVAVEATVDADNSTVADSEAPKLAEEAPLELVVDGDSALAFVDKTGQQPVPPELVTPVDSEPPLAKRAGPADGANDEGANKRAKVEADAATSSSSSPTPSGVKAEPLALDLQKQQKQQQEQGQEQGQEQEGEPPGFLVEVPTSLPLIAECPHLLFDPPTNEDGAINTAAGSELPNELVERLSDALSDSAVFQGVRDLCTNQEQRDLDMLRRWQELVRMQMRERAELNARHAQAEQALGKEDTRAQIERKMAHLQQRHEFVSRCLSSQKQFLTICAMDRTSALRAQQISLENMKIPEITVTSDPARIDQQRAIVSVILEAEKLWREDQGAGASAKPEPSASASSPPLEKRRFGRDSADSPSSHAKGARAGGYSGGNGFSRDSSTRGGRGGYRRDGGRGGGWEGGRGGGRGAFRRDDSRPYAGRGGTDRYRRDPRRDPRDPRKPYYESRDAPPSTRATGPSFDSGGGGGAPGPARFEPQRPPRMQEEYDPYAPQFHRTQPEPQAYYPPSQHMPPPQQQQLPPPHRQEQQPPPVQYAPTPGSYDAYGRRRDTLPPPRGAPYAQQTPAAAAPSAFGAPDRYPHDPRRPRPDDRYAGPPQASAGPADWQRPTSHPPAYRQERQEPPSQPYRRRDPLPTSDRVVEYSVGGIPEGEYRSDPHLSRYGAPPSAAAPPAAYAPQAPPPHQQPPHQQQRGYPRPQDMGPGPASQPPPYDPYAPYDYPPMQHQQPPPSFDGPRAFGSGRGGGFAPPPYQPYEQPPADEPYGGYHSVGPRSHGRGGYGRGRGGRRGGGPRPFRR